MVKKKLTVLAFALGFFAVQHLHADKTLVNTVGSAAGKTVGSVRTQACSMLRWSKQNKWYIALPTLAAVTVAVALYQFNESFKDHVDQLFGLKTAKPMPVVKPAPKPAKPKPRPRPRPKPHRTNEEA